MNILKTVNTNAMRVSFLLFAFLFTGSLHAQDQVPITNGTEVTCDGFFTDDGPGGGPYTANTNYTFTLCPDNPGDVISVDFTAFSLYVSPNPNNSDRLFIYDGDDANAASLGSYAGTSLQGTPVTGTVNNTSGCLTFVFNAGPNSNSLFPGWEGTILCTTPCANPTSSSVIVDPVPTGTEQSVGVCLGTPITFGDTGSAAEPGFVIENWIWNYGDGTIDVVTNSNDVTHEFTEPGEYIVTLAVEDNNGCRSLNLEPLQVLVSTIPVFNTDFDSPVCLDEINQIDANPIQSVTWTALPPQVAAGETYLADGAGFSYSSTLTFDFFEPGETLDDCADLEGVFTNMEHSYLGDLQMSITCPNGTNVVLLAYPNGGGGTYLGVALDDNTQNPGEGWDYGWQPGLTNGNLSAQTDIPVGGPTPGSSVPPGFYESDNDMCALVGCPLNGDWTFNVLDNLGADNGFIFAWGINFNPLLFPDITTFTPVIGLDADSSWWEGPNIVNTSADGNIIDVTYSTTGDYDYTYFATNNFGCTFDTTITVSAIEGPEITAGPDKEFCTDPVQLEGSLVSGGAAFPNGMSWAWTPGTNLTDPSLVNPFVTALTQNTSYTLTGIPVGFPGCTVTDQVLVSLNPAADPGLDTDSIFCYNSPISFLIDYLDGTPAFGGEWTDVAGNVVPNQINPTDYPAGVNLVYTYTVGTNQCIGQSVLDLTILPATDPTCCQTNAVAGDDAQPCSLEYELHAEPALGLGTWTGPANVTFSDIHDPTALATCAYPGEIATLTWTDDNGFACAESDDVVITFSEPVSLIVVPENANCFDECSGTAVGIASGGTAPNGEYMFDWGDENGVAGVIPQTRDSLCTGSYQVVVTDIAGCMDSLIYSIGEPAAQTIFITQTPPLCAEECSGVIQITSEGAVEYSFDGGISYGTDNSTYSCEGVFDVIAKNANGCEIHRSVTLIDPLMFEANFNINPLPTTTKNTLINFQDVSTPGPIQSSFFQYGIDPIIGEGDSRISNFKFPSDTSGVYPVILTSTNANGCTDTTMKNVVIHDDLLWYIPNSFTPNGDGINDIWHPVGNTIDIRDYELTIMDRWGNKVFATNDYNKGWNGSQDGNGSHYLAPGVYTYLIKVSSATTEDKRELTGFITMVK